MPQESLKVLPKKARDMWEAVYERAKETTCKERADKEACAARIAWAAVKRKYHKDPKTGKWVERKSEAVEYFDPQNHVTASLTMHFAKVPVSGGKLRWHAVASDTDVDLRGDRATIQLFQSFVERIKDGASLPYLSISHYRDNRVPATLRHLFGERTVAGMTEEVYVDGNRLKARGYFEETPLGIAAFKAIREQMAEGTPPDERIRISMGFFDFAHIHEIDGISVPFRRKSITDTCPFCEAGFTGRRFIDGQLVHLALTRVPVNPRTPIEVEGVVEMSDAIRTRLEDAASIVGEDLAKMLDELENGAVQEEAFVVFSEADGEAAGVEEHDADLTDDASDGSDDVVGDEVEEFLAGADEVTVKSAAEEEVEGDGADMHEEVSAMSQATTQPVEVNVESVIAQLAQQIAGQIVSAIEQRSESAQPSQPVQQAQPPQQEQVQQATVEQSAPQDLAKVVEELRRQVDVLTGQVEALSRVMQHHISAQRPGIPPGPIIVERSEAGKTGAVPVSEFVRRQFGL